MTKLVKKTVALVVVFALTFGMALALRRIVVAQVTPLTDFGGFVTAIIPCTCSAGVWTLVINPNPQNAALSGPYLWSFFNLPMHDDLTLDYPFPGMSLLGKTVQDGDECQITIGTGCITLPVRATIDQYTGKGIQYLGS